MASILDGITGKGPFPFPAEAENPVLQSLLDSAQMPVTAPLWHTDAAEKLSAVTLQKLPHGGYVAFRGRGPRGMDDFSFSPELAAFSTLPEAVDWVQRNMEANLFVSA